jgi:hypothetical protein
MFKSSHRYQRGQAMSEFIAAMALFLPLILGMIYIAKYSDIKHQAIQASRYAAFEGALDPSNESAGVLTEETRARFFTDGSLNNGNIGYQDTTAGLNTAGTLNPVWNEVNGTPMVTRYSDVSVTFQQPSINGTGLSAINTAGKNMFSLDGGGQVQANVEVDVAAITHFASLNNILSIGATTVVAGDAWNAAGAADVTGHFSPASVPASILKPITQPFDYLFQFFSSSDGPQWGCVNADAVPADHLDNYNAPAPCKN